MTKEQIQKLNAMESKLYRLHLLQQDDPTEFNKLSIEFRTFAADCGARINEKDLTWHHPIDAKLIADLSFE